MSKIEVNQAILVRDIIDMAREYKNDANVLEYISCFCFQLDLIFDESGTLDKNLNWYDVFSHYDEKYYNLSQNNNSEIDELVVNKVYDYAVNIINSQRNELSVK